MSCKIKKTKIKQVYDNNGSKFGENVIKVEEL